MDNTSVDVEGNFCFRYIGTDTYVLGYDRYNDSPSKFGYSESTDLVTFSTPQILTTTGFTPRHGSVTPLTQAEYNALLNHDWSDYIHLPAVTIDAELKLNYQFDEGSGTTAANSALGYTGANDGTLNGSAAFGLHKSIYSYMATGSSNGYLDMGSGASQILFGQDDFTIASYIYIESSAALSGNGWFLWSFANADNVAGSYPCVWLRATDTRATFSATGYINESYFQTGNILPKGVWQHIMYRQIGDTGVI